MYKLVSELDKSVNIVDETSNGFLEARYVRRDDRKILVYISSQTGCDQFCRMCHLTATGQTSLRNATREEMVAQAREVLKEYDGGAEVCHFNFMARGEPTNNPAVDQNLFRDLQSLAHELGMHPRILISTILPEGNDALSRYSAENPYPEIYYSLYSTDLRVRKKWLPKADELYWALKDLKDYQRMTGKVPRIHFSFIKGVNDSAEEVGRILGAIESADLDVKFNIVRYNPYSDKYGEEASEEFINQAFELISKEFPCKVIPRVGTDVSASCGMFVE